MYIKSYDGYYDIGSFDLSLYDGYSWSDTTTVDIEFGANVAPELRSVSDGSIIGGTLNTTIRTNERRAINEYISYYDDPNDDDENINYLTVIRPSGATGLELGHTSHEGTVTSGIISNTNTTELPIQIISSDGYGFEAGDWLLLDDFDNYFLVGSASASNSAESFEIRVSDGYAWSEWYTINITTGANALPTLNITNPNLELGTWTKL